MFGSTFNFGFTADLVFGPRGEDATFLSPELRPGGNSSIVNQLYAYWNVSDAFTLTLGNFNTFLGYEVILFLDLHQISYPTVYNMFILVKKENFPFLYHAILKKIVKTRFPQKVIMGHFFGVIYRPYGRLRQNFSLILFLPHKFSNSTILLIM